jgi:hypothetical protein
MLSIMKTSFLFFFIIFINSPTFRPPDYIVLFVGNSLTYSNDLPETVKKEAGNLGVKIKYDILAHPNYSLEDHWEEGVIQKMLVKKKYDFVIIQQGPSSLNEGKESLIKYGKQINELLHQKDTKLVYFMVWPSKARWNYIDQVIDNYTEAASINNAIICPVGKVWKQEVESSGDFDFLAIDGFHLSVSGSKKAAQIISNTLFNRSPLSNQN